jgi:hypothetical protein
MKKQIKKPKIISLKDAHDQALKLLNDMESKRLKTAEKEAQQSIDLITN